jgi:hypothetical protein
MHRVIHADFLGLINPFIAEESRGKDLAIFQENLPTSEKGFSV